MAGIIGGLDKKIDDCLSEPSGGGDWAVWHWNFSLQNKELGLGGGKRVDHPDFSTDETR